MNILSEQTGENINRTLERHLWPLLEIYTVMFGNVKRESLLHNKVIKAKTLFLNRYNANKQI